MENQVKVADVMKAITEKAQDAKGFVIFMGTLGHEEDKDGNIQLNYDYVRHQVGFEDVQKCVNQFRKDMMADLMKQGQ